MGAVIVGRGILLSLTRYVRARMDASVYGVFQMALLKYFNF